MLLLYRCGRAASRVKQEKCQEVAKNRSAPSLPKWQEVLISRKGISSNPEWLCKSERQSNNGFPNGFRLYRAGAFGEHQYSDLAKIQWFQRSGLFGRQTQSVLLRRKRDYLEGDFSFCYATIIPQRGSAVKLKLEKIPSFFVRRNRIGQH